MALSVERAWDGGRGEERREERRGEARRGEARRWLRRDFAIRPCLDGGGEGFVAVVVCLFVLKK